MAEVHVLLIIDDNDSRIQGVYTNFDNAIAYGVRCLEETRDGFVKAYPEDADDYEVIQGNDNTWRLVQKDHGMVEYFIVESHKIIEGGA